MASLEEYPTLMAQLMNRAKASIVIESILLVILILLALLGNSLVCYVLARNTRLKTTPNMLVANLAVSDILMAGICMPLSLGVSLTGTWHYGAVVCDAQGFLIFSFGIVSVWTMCLIAVNRYIAISHPFLYTKTFTASRMRITIIFLWLLPWLATIPPFVGWGHYAFQPGKVLCMYPFNVDLTYTFLVQCLFIAIPMNLILYSYSKCYFAMRANNRRVAGMMTSGDQADARRKAQEARATRTMMVATAGFIMCWLPVSIIDFVDAFTGGSLPRQVYMLNAYLIYISSTINPFVYWLINADFRRAFNQVLPCLKFIRRDTSEVSPSVVGPEGGSGTNTNITITKLNGTKADGGESISIAQQARNNPEEASEKNTNISGNSSRI